MTIEQHWYLVWILGTVAGAWALPRQLRHWFLVLVAAVFLGTQDPVSLMLMALLTLVTGFTTINWKAKDYAVLGAVFGCFLGLFIYRLVGQNELVLFGFAFYVLRVIHFLLEAYKGRISGYGWSDIVAWMWFLPTLQVGPIHRFPEFQRDKQRYRWDSAMFARGLDRILFGYVKVIFVGNYLIGDLMEDELAKLSPDGWWFHYLDTLHYGLLLYVKFSGYSDIAVGFSLLLGYRIIENFNFPFLASDVSDFWRRWHISLSSWCRDYVYVPVFSVTRRPAIAALATMIILGLWHELSLRYLAWGLWHGIGIAVVQKWQTTNMSQWLNQGLRGRLYKPVSIFITLQFVILSFVITSSDTLKDALDRFRILLGAGA